MESNDTPHGSELVPHWVFINNSNFGPMGPEKFNRKFLYTKLVRYHEVILWGFEAKIVFRAKQASNIQSPDFRLSVGQKIKSILRHQKVVYVNRQVKRKLLKLFLGQKMIPLGLLGALIDP